MNMRTVRPNSRNTGGTRPESAVDLLVYHCTQGSTAAGAAGWWARPSVASGTEGSAHVVIDNLECIRAVDDLGVAYGARGHNWNGWHLELAGFAAWSPAEWATREVALGEAARIVAAVHKRFGIPVQPSSVASDGKMHRGYHTHIGLPGNDHRDPGPGFPLERVIAAVKGLMAGRAPDRVPERRPFGASLTVIRGNPGEKRYRRFSGWTEDEMRPDYGDGPAGPVLEALAALRRPVAVPYLITWKGGTWRDPSDIPRVARTILARF